MQSRHFGSSPARSLCEIILYIKKIHLYPRHRHAEKHQRETLAL